MSSAPKIDESEAGYSHDEVLARYKAQVPVNSDFTAPRSERVFSVPSLVKMLAPVVKNPKDMICLEFILNTTMVVLPVSLFNWSLPLWLSNMWVLIPCWLISYLAIVLTFYERFFLTMHVTAHNKLFVKDYNFLNCFMETILAPFFGVPSGMYYMHHCVMHHTENNVVGKDLSSTMPYQRDYLWHHLCYIAGYVGGFPQMMKYIVNSGRKAMSVYALSAMATYLLTLGTLYSFNPLGTALVCFVPFAVSCIMLMTGNMAQHLFIDPTNRFDNFGLAFNVINSPMNQRTYNDGYHIIHHMNSRIHWTDVPKWFEDNIELFAKKDSLVFNTIDIFQVWIYTITGNYKALYQHWVQLTPNKRSLEEFTQLLKSRLVPLDGVPEKKAKTT